MNLLDGYLKYRSLSVSAFVEESITWDNIGLIGVICDDQNEAISDLYIPLMAINSLNGRDLRIFDANEDLITVYQNERGAVPEFTDHIFDWMWEEDRDGWTPPSNILDSMSFELIRKEATREGYYALFFFKFPEYLDGVDFTASQIAVDYTYGSTFDEVSHARMKRELFRYYIYNQEENVFYDFKTFTR